MCRVQELLVTEPTQRALSAVGLEDTGSESLLMQAVPNRCRDVLASDVSPVFSNLRWRITGTVDERGIVDSYFEEHFRSPIEDHEHGPDREVSTRSKSEEIDER